MRTRKNKNLSAFKRTPSLFSDLITNSENTISSQATVVSKNSYNYVGTQSHDRSFDFQFYQDIITEETQQLRISPQQQKRIQGILQLARKGKINPGNAFEIPLQVADPQIGEGQNMRFWKFASELLHASMGIYDKRVQHVFLGANRMFNNLIRVGSNKIQEDQQPEVRQQKKKAELMKIDLAQLGDASKVAGYEIASVNCQQSHKISLKKHVNQFAADPLFNKTLQAFDSDSLKSLFLNVFETGPHLQVLFFHESKQADNKRMEIESQQILTNENEENDQQSTKTQQVQKQAIPRFINDEFKKLNLIVQTKTSFESISSFRQEVAKMGVKEDENYVRGTIQSFSQHSNFFQNKLDLTSQRIDQSQEISLTQNDFHEQVTSFSLNFQPQIVQQIESAPIEYSDQKELSDQSFFSYKRESNSLITPWQYEFKGRELIKKNNPRKKGTKKGSKDQNEQKKKKAELEIDFLEEIKINRKNVLSCKAQSKTTLQRKYQEKNLLPLQFDPSIFTNSRRKLFSNQQSTSYLNPLKKTQNIPLNTTQNNEPQQQGQAYQQPVRMQFEHSDSVQRAMGPQNIMKNIRDLKEKVLQKVAEVQYMLISEIDLGVGPASMLVIILHLVNQHKIQIIEQIDDDIKVRAC